MSLPPSAKGARRRDPEPSEPHGPGLQAKTCSWSCLSWLHPLRSWSLRQTRGGSNCVGQVAFAAFELKNGFVPDAWLQTSAQDLVPELRVGNVPAVRKC